MQDQLDQQIDQQLGLLQEVYSLVVNFAVTYSFQLLGAVVVVIVGYVIGGWLARMLLGVMERRNVDVTLRQFIASTGRMIVVGIFLIIALSQMGVSITPLIAAIGGLAVGASFAIQAPVSNYGAGLVIILTRMYKVGDTISVCDCAGIVRDVSLATTILESEDGEQIVIPNKQIVGEIHRNSFANRIVEGEIGIAHDAEPEDAIRCIEEALAGIAEVTRDPLPVVGINRFTETAIVLDYRVWVSSEAFYQALHAVNLSIHKALKANGIGVARPRVEVLQSSSGQQ